MNKYLFDIKIIGLHEKEFEEVENVLNSLELDFEFTKYNLKGERQ